MNLDGHDAPTYLAEQNLRRQIDRSVSRALADGDFASQLLRNPALALADHGCAPQHRRSLLGIRAVNLTDFARQAQALFWIVDLDAASPCEEYAQPLAAGARR
jgi:hypothetical protein